MRALLLLSAATLLACSRPAPSNTRAGDDLATIPRLPTGERLDPDGRSFDLGSMPLAMAMSPERDRIAVLLNGWREQGIQIVDAGSGQVTQTLPQAAAFLGIAYSPDGHWLYSSGGNQDVIYRYAWRGRQATLQDSIVLGAKRPNQNGTRYPSGLATSRDGAALYVAENLADSLAVIDLANGTVVQRLATERYPYGPVVGLAGEVYVAAWGGNTVSVFKPQGVGGRLADGGRWRVVRHPSALLLNHDGSRLFVTSGSTDRIGVYDTRDGHLVKELSDAAPAGPSEGSTPNALALSADGSRLYVAEADNNAVAVFDLSSATAGTPTATGTDSLRGRIPAGWYPTAVTARGDTLFTVSGKGRGTGPNRDYEQPGGAGRLPPRSYTLGQTSGTLTISLNARATGDELARLTTRTANANNWGTGRVTTPYPPITHVVYIIKENRTYDQVFGDMTQGDGDTSLAFFRRAEAPNHHALADRFGLFDRFFVNAEVSPDGHNWSTAAYATDYLEKTIPSNYSNRGRSYDYEGTNRNRVPADEGHDDVAEPASGYLWDAVQHAGRTLRNYGEFVIPDRAGAGQMPAGYRGNKPFLAANTNRDFPGFDLNIADQRRADIFIAEFRQFVQQGKVPSLMIVRLPNDHTAGGRAGVPTPRAYMADNDLALGRIVAAISESAVWKETAIFVVEDDAQNGPDHVDSHRSPFLAISPYSRRGTNHRFVNTTDVLATIEELLGLSPLSQFDHFGRPLRDIWTREPDLTPYVVLTPSTSLDERNRATGRDAEESKLLTLDFEDTADEGLFNRILWRQIKGPTVPYPGATRMSALEWKRSR
jgi:DNA-binding beta-propeller fold protein YncE